MPFFEAHVLTDELETGSSEEKDNRCNEANTHEEEKRAELKEAQEQVHKLEQELECTREFHKLSMEQLTEVSQLKNQTMED